VPVLALALTLTLDEEDVAEGSVPAFSAVRAGLFTALRITDSVSFIIDS
jgi:hypothetical protein